MKDPGSRAARESMTLDDWRWNADQFNRIGEQVNAAGMRFAYHNHMTEFRSENGVVFYDELLRLTDPTKVTMELDCGWMVAGRQESGRLSHALSYAFFHAARERLQAERRRRGLSLRLRQNWGTAVSTIVPFSRRQRRPASSTPSWSRRSSTCPRWRR